MARVSPYLPTDRQSDYALLAFPEKLWWIVNNPKREEIHWNSLGTGIVIPSIQKFVSEILNNPSSAIFKTKHFASFVRQLNLYGFRKVTEYAKRTSTSPLSFLSKCEFKHPYFRKGRRDLLVHVKRQLFSAKKPRRRQPKGNTPCAIDRPFDQPPLTSQSATWNPTLYTPMPFVPWQTSLQMPFTLYAPFCNTYQLTHMQQGPVGGLPNVQGLGLQGQFKQSPTSPSLMWTQSLGPCEGNVKSISSYASIIPETTSSQEPLPVEAVESLNSLHSLPAIKTTTAAPDTTPNVAFINNMSHQTAIPVTESSAEHRSFIPINSPAALSATHTSSAAGNNTCSQSVSQKNTHPPRRESAEPYVSCSPYVTVHGLLKESAGKPYDSGLQSLTPDAFLRESTTVTKPCGSQPQSFTLKVGEREGSSNDEDSIKVQGLCKGLPLSCV